MEKIKQDEFEDRKPIKPVPGQMCYDEFLLPEQTEQNEIMDNSVASGQLDFWNLPKEEISQTQQIEKKKFEKSTESFSREETFKNQLVLNDSVYKNSETRIEKTESTDCKIQENLTEFQSPKTLKKPSNFKSNFNEIDENFDENENDVQQEALQVVETETEDLIDENFAEQSDDNQQEFSFDFENPPKKLEKSEINASKTHFFGNYENPFDE